MNFVRSSKGVEIRSAATEDRLASLVNTVLPSLQTKIAAVLTPRGLSHPTVAVLEKPRNTINGTLKLRVSAYQAKSRLEFEIVVPFDHEVPQLPESAIVAAYEAGLTAQKAAPAKTLDNDIATYKVDLTLVTAKRVRDLVIYASEELPLWEFVVPTDTLKNKVNHHLVASKILASITGHCLSSFYRTAEFDAKSFSLPVVREVEVVAKYKPVIRIGEDLEVVEAKANAEVTERNLLLAIQNTTPRQATAEDIKRDRHQAFINTIQSGISQAITNHVRSVLQGVLRSVIAVDTKGVSQGVDGVVRGSILATVCYYAKQGIEETTLELPLDSRGTVLTKDIKKSEAAVAAEAKREAEMKILSEDEAKKELDAYRKSLEAKNAEVRAALDVEAGVAPGSNLMAPPVAARIPILKALLPSETKEGDKINLRGYVYQVCASDYNACSVETGAFWMLALTDELPTAKMQTGGVWASLDGVFSRG